MTQNKANFWEGQYEDNMMSMFYLLLLFIFYYIISMILLKLAQAVHSQTTADNPHPTPL